MKITKEAKGMQNVEQEVKTYRKAIMDIINKIDDVKFLNRIYVSVRDYINKK